ncbi:phage holin family protein [Propionibacterium sp.]|uniref:phage holin family protein n=1 Tax=Propionibacterium sp. TaxID=1977903 RepID=UPI0039E751DC
MFARTLVNALAVAIATWLISGIILAPWDPPAKQALSLVIVALVLGFLNSFVKPILHLLGSCLIVITFGLFLWAINAALLMLTSSLCGVLGVGWQVLNWNSAFGGSLIISVVAMVLGRFLPASIR